MGNATIVNFASGETSPKSRGRFDIASYNSSCRKLENFIADVQGSARFRPGFKHAERIKEWVLGTASACRFIPFQVEGGSAYMLEFTPGKMRVYRDGALQLVPNLEAVTGIVEGGAGAAKITMASVADFDVGDEIVLSGIVGPTELNGRPFVVSAKITIGDDGLQVYDPNTGVQLLFADLSTAYESGGSTSKVVMVATPYYATAEINALNFAQTTSVMYIACYRHPPYKLSLVSATGTWTLGTYSRTNDPLVAPATINVTGASVSGVHLYVTLASAAVDEHLYTVAGVVGTIAASVNAKWRLQSVPNIGGSPTYELLNPTTGEASGGGSGTYTSGGTATPDADNPIAVAFYESRLYFAGTNARPYTLFGSRTPIPTTGATRYDDYTGGTDADHAVFFTLAPTNGQIDYITWAVGTAKYLVVGAFGGVFRVSGGGLDEPITSASINVRPIDSYGCAATPPAVNGAFVYYIQRGGVTVRTVRYSVDADDLVSVDLCLNSEHISSSPLSRVVFQAGRPDALWVLREDGELAVVTLDNAERIAGWHRHTPSGDSAKFVEVAPLARINASDQIWVATERSVADMFSGAVRRYAEYMVDEVAFPDIEEYYGVAATAALDAAAYRAAIVALLNTAVHLDAYETYNSTPATVISGLHHLIGETVTAVADGVERTGLVVSAAGAITLPVAASVVHVGLPYTGYLQTQNLEVGGRSGPAQAKPRNINALNIRFLNSKGGQYGTDLYHLYDIDTEDPDALTLADGTAAPVFNGIRSLQHSDVWSTETDRNEKTVFIRQAKPFPCVVQFIDIEYETGDE